LIDLTVDLKPIDKQIKNWTGAEIESLSKNTFSLALSEWKNNE
jgi:hypothetical protein